MFSMKQIDSLKLKEDQGRLKDQRKILTRCSLNGREIEIKLNTSDTEALQEEQETISLIELLKERYHGIKEIPEEEILRYEFNRLRLPNSKDYMLTKVLKKGGGIVAIRDKK